jgi:hypothetical protein
MGMIDELHHLLQGVRARAGATFCGVGVLICDNPQELPLVPLRLDRQIPAGDDLPSVLAELSRSECDLHDGFHVLSSSLRLIRVAQYFSPPAPQSVVIDRSRPIGGRYLAAQFGSALPQVGAAGVLGRGLALAVFSDGLEVRFESAP